MKKQKNKFNLKEQYKKSWKFIKDSKKYILASVLIFFIFAFIGFFFPPPEILKTEILKLIQELLLKTEGLSHIELIKFIFLNNLQSSFLGMAFGIFFGIFPVIVSAINGYILGFVSSLAVHTGGFSSLWKIFPHGIFELPAVFIALGTGIKFGTVFFQKNIRKNFKESILNCLRVFLFVVIPLLIIAAIIEGSLIFFMK